MFENYVKEVSYTLASVIVVIFGDTLTEKIIIPFINSIIPKQKSIITAVIGTILFLLYCVIAVSVISYLLNSEIINRNNVNPIAIISFIVLMLFLVGKYGWMQL